MIRRVAFIVLFLCVVAGVYGRYKPLPEGISAAWPVRETSPGNIRFFSDSTYPDASGKRMIEQEIFDEALRMIRGADSYILADFFFYSDFLGTATSSHRELSRELTDALIAKKKSDPSVSIQVITDPINTMYGGYDAPQFARLRDSGIDVVITDLQKLRDSNPLYSGFWRVIGRYVPNIGGSIFPNLLDASKPKIGLSSYIDSFNFKANHRKVLVADDGRGGLSALITSANPHDGSSAHSNVALRIDGPLAIDVAQSEGSVIRMSGYLFVDPPAVSNATGGTARVRLITERDIKDTALAMIGRASAGDTIDMAMFYMSDRDIIAALKAADARGASVRLLLDPNKDAFGREKNGIPNRPVARELLKNATRTQVRWCNTTGEQCHGKMLIVRADGNTSMMLGSANFTRRNLDDLNLETNVYVEGAAIAPANAYFESAWNNRHGNRSVPYETYGDGSFAKTLWYRWGEFSGASRY